MIYQMIAPQNMDITYYNQHMRYKFFIPSFISERGWIFMATPGDEYYSEANKIVETVE